VSARLDESDNRRRISDAVDALDETIKEIRSAIFSLHSRPATVEPGLRARILELVDEAGGALGFAPGLRMSGSLDGEVLADVGEHLLAALREGLSNAARHARADKVDVLVEADQELVLLVRDNGVGIKHPQRRSGLANLAERAGLLGGTVRTEPAEGGGTELTWRVPLPEPRPASTQETGDA
jgi:signal transduction histidine kinase